MKPAQRRFEAKYINVADAIAQLDIDQEVREQVAKAVTGGFLKSQAADFDAELFEFYAKTPLSDCAGPDPVPYKVPCPDHAKIRTRMHLAPERGGPPSGRAVNWRATKPVRWCMQCGLSALYGRQRAG